RMPYGPREPAEVLGFTREAMRWFSGRDCKLVVIACNTATSVALEAVRDESAVPIIGVIRPGAAAALTATARRAIGVLATVLTVRSGAYVRALRDLDPLVDVAQQACPRLVPLVEAGRANDSAGSRGRSSRRTRQASRRRDSRRERRFGHHGAALRRKDDALQPPDGRARRHRLVLGRGGGDERGGCEGARRPRRPARGALSPEEDDAC